MLGDEKMNDETVKGLLRKAGLKVTNQRMIVLDIIASHPAEHLTDWLRYTGLSRSF